MPRKARITIAGAVHHVMSRGLEGNPIFRSDDDRRFLMALIEKNLRASGYLLYAWCLMENHYHLVLRVNEYPLARFMRLVNGPYAQYFRKGQGKRGYLFQDRFKSITAQDQRYLEELIRYVHLNPIRAGVCANLSVLQRYPWCGHGVIMGTAAWPVQNTTDVLRRYGNTIPEARRRYESFLQEGIGAEPGLHATLRTVNSGCEDMHTTSCWVIGNRDFVLEAIKQSRRRFLAAHACREIGVEHIAELICSTLNIGLDQIKYKSRNSPGSKARKLIAFVAHRQYCIPVTQIARYFMVMPASVSNMLRAGEGLAGTVQLPCLTPPLQDPDKRQH